MQYWEYNTILSKSLVHKSLTIYLCICLLDEPIYDSIHRGRTVGRASGGIMKNGYGGAHADKNKLLPVSVPPPLVRIVLGLQPIFV